MTEDRWLSLEEITLHLGVKKDTVYKWLAAKKIPAHKVGRLWKFSKPEIDAWVKSGAANHRKSDNAG
jgi:excisionase family DNA binding protein